jgi:hypothetical protein
MHSAATHRNLLDLMENMALRSSFNLRTQFFLGYCHGHTRQKNIVLEYVAFLILVSFTGNHGKRVLWFTAFWLVFC